MMELATVDVSECAWFVAVTVIISCLVFVVCGALEIVERYGFFEDAKIQKGVVVLHLAKLHFIAQPLGLPLFYFLLKSRGVSFSRPGPSWQEPLFHFPIFLLVEDTWFYWAHRALHTTWFYKSIHKMHHEYKRPNAWAVEYTHILEYVSTNSVGLFLGPFLLGSHIFTFWMWLVIRLLEGIDGHCGYDFWFSPFRYFPFRPGANIHDYHHSHNTGNYGSFFVFWDTVCGTNLSYADYKKRQATEKIS